MPTTEPERLLAWLSATALVSAAISSGYIVFAPEALTSPWKWATGIGFVVTCGLVLALFRTRRPAVRRALALALLVVAAALWVTSVGPLLIPLQLVSLVLLVNAWSVRAGVVGWLALTVFTIALYVTFGGVPARAVTESIGVSALMLFGLALAVLLRRLGDAGDRDRARMAELDAANARLQRSLDVEKELVLAEERARMSRELHDGLGHRLTLASMRLELADRLADSRPEASREAVREGRGMVVESIDAMRMWVRALSPAGEPGLSGRAAMEAIADSFRTTGLTVEVLGDGDPAELGEAASLLGYRIVQEGLTNALRHSDARHVAIRLDEDLHDGRPALRITVTNRLPAAEASDAVIGKGGFGLRSLAERAAAVGGALTAGADGDAFVLSAVLPKSPLSQEGP